MTNDELKPFTTYYYYFERGILMKKIFSLTLSLILTITFLAACGGDASTETVQDAASNAAEVSVLAVKDTAVDAVDTTTESITEQAAALNTDYADALPVRNQLTLGILGLDNDSALAVSPQQAAKMLPLWQALNSLTKSGTGAQAEIDALLLQIEGELTPEQIKAIAAMHLSREDTQRVAQEWGLSNGEGGGEDGQQGGGKNMSESERATRRAEQGKTDDNSSGGVSAALLEQLVQLLQERAQ